MLTKLLCNSKRALQLIPDVRRAGVKNNDFVGSEIDTFEFRINLKQKSLT